MAGLPTIYKKYQGQYTRSLTAVGLGLVALALCFFVFTLLQSYVPTADVQTMPPQNATTNLELAQAFEAASGVVYQEGTPVTAEVKQALVDKNIPRWHFRAIDPVPYALYVQYGVPAALFVVLGVLTFWLVNKPSFADFLIATESEMKKVSWSSKQELIGSTIVVIVTVVILSLLIYVADFIWTFGFTHIGVLPKGQG